MSNEYITSIRSKKQNQQNQSSFFTKEETSKITVPQNEYTRQKRFHDWQLLDQINVKSMQYNLLKEKCMQFMQKNFLYYKMIQSIIIHINDILRQFNLEYNTSQQIQDDDQEAFFEEDNVQIVKMSNYILTKFKRISDNAKDYKHISQFKALNKQIEKLTKRNQQLSQKYKDGNNGVLKLKLFDLQKQFAKVSQQLERKKSIIDKSEKIQLELINQKNYSRQHLSSLLTHLIRRIKSHQSTCNVVDQLHAQELNKILGKNTQKKVQKFQMNVKPIKQQENQSSNKKNQKSVKKTSDRSMIKKDLDKSTRVKKNQRLSPKGNTSILPTSVNSSVLPPRVPKSSRGKKFQT